MRVLLSVLLLATACAGEAPDPQDVPIGEGNDPLARTRAELCTRWKRDHVEVQESWDGATATCEPGAVADQDQENGLRRTNLYRWLVGLPPVIHEPMNDAGQQECALMMAANGTINHYPPSDWKCWASDGAQAAGRSNLALGTGMTLAGSVDGFIEDGGENNWQEIGHRRWILDPGMRSTSFGRATSESLAFLCMHVWDALQPDEMPAVDFIAYPPPGPMPLDAAVASRITFSTSAYLVTPRTTVEVSLDGEPPVLMPVTIGNAGIGRVRTTLVVDGPGRAELGETMEVHVRGLTRDDKDAADEDVEVSWTTKWVDCAP